MAKNQNGGRFFPLCVERESHWEVRACNYDIETASGREKSGARGAGQMYSQLCPAG
jgi:hypothetical protein